MASMTLDEQEEIFLYAQYAFFDLIPLIISCVSYGAFLLVSIIAFRSLASSARKQTALLLCLSAIFIGFTWNVLFWGGSNLTITWYSLVQTLEEGFLAQYDTAWAKVTRWRYISSWGTTLNLLLSDTIVVWRAYMLFQHAKFWRYTLVILMVSNIVINVADSIWDTVNLSAFLSTPATLDWVSILLSLVVNMVATTLFAWKARTYHRNYHQSTTSSISRRTQRTNNILNLIVESGAIFCAIQALYLVILLLFQYDVIKTLQWPVGIVDAISVIGSSYNPVAVMVMIQMNSTLQNEESSCAPGVTVWSENIYFSTFDLEMDDGSRES